LRLSGLVLTPPRGWTRDDGGGVPGFRPAADPCRFFVLGDREAEGTAKEAHDALLGALRAGNTPVGGTTAGERGGFLWSAGQLRDAAGRSAWFTLFTAARDGRLEAVLFQADTKAAYDAHRGAVEAMIDGAALADPAKREEREEAGDVRFARPAGWTRETRDGAEWLVPPGVPPGRVCAVVISPGEELAGNARDWFSKTWDELVAGGKASGGELEVRRGERFDTLFRSAVVERGGRSLFVTLVAFTPGSRVECLLYLADDREQFERHMPAADALVAGIGFRSLDGPAPKTAKIEGAWWRVEYAFDPSTRSRDPQNYFLFFYEGGLACRAWRAEGQDGLDPEREMARADASWGEWGRRSETDAAVVVRWANGGESTFARGEKGSLVEGTSNPYVALPPVDGLALDGLYRYGDGTLIQGASQFEIRFTRDGRFEESNFCSCVHRDGPRAGKGRYRIANYTLYLDYDTGERSRMGFYALGKADAFHANNNVFSRAK
jgi:hypothetical protein